MKSYLKAALIAVVGGGLSVGATGASAALITDVFGDGWTQFQNGGAAEDMDDIGGNFQVDPGWGGQAFDAEYLLWKMEGSVLFLGLQTGFDLVDGQQDYGGKTYYSGDLALSFDSTPETYEYAVDFGLETKDFYSTPIGLSGTGIDTSGLYRNVTWDGKLAFDSFPFAMKVGTSVGGSFAGLSGKDEYYENGRDVVSYYHIVSFDLAQVLGPSWADGLTIGAHWTMSCGNDVIDGTFDVAPVPEPATMFLFGTGLVGLAGMVRRKKK